MYSPADCQAAACALGVQVWQYCPPGNGPCGAQSCWVGDLSDCSLQPDGSNWVGAGRPASGPAPSAPEAQPSFDDSAWPILDIPHDATIVNNYTASANGGEAFLPPAITWYRKHFFLPPSFQGTSITLVVDGALSTSWWWLNGVQLVAAKPNGYLPLVLRLDTANVPLIYGNSSAPNVLVAYVDGGKTTGWWYEGSGLMRHARLISASPIAAVAPFGVASPGGITGAITAGTTPADGLVAASAYVTGSATIAVPAPSLVTVTFLLQDATGVTVGNSSVTSYVQAGPTTLSGGNIIVTDAQLWSIPRPYLYTLVVQVSAAGSGGAVLDQVSESVGIRSVAWDANKGLLLNGQPVKMRGGCNHESFAAVGAAIPDRIDLLRVQQMRGSGFNSWRTSHNPPEPILLDITDRLGILVLDENRVLATNVNCPGCNDVPSYSGVEAEDVGALALRDRNHASVAWWSLCNEAGCGNGGMLNGVVPASYAAAYTNDGSRAVGANMGWISPTDPGTPMSDLLDVMGMSHNGLDAFTKFHAAEPNKPLVATECCSCETQRGEDADLPHNTSYVYFSNENQQCLEDQTQVSNGQEYIAGTFVWTIHDYVGEPGNWPHVSSSFGAWDLAGFPKAPVWWYRSWWLANISSTSPDRAPLANTSAFAHIVESWQNSPTGQRTINVYTNAASVRLLVNGAPVGTASVPAYGKAQFTNVSYTPGTLTAQALAADGQTVLATDSKSSWGAPAGIVLSLDAPTPLTGTGSALYLDGGDAALVRATIVDSAGNVVSDASLNITFAVTAGPGAITGCGNGDPANQDPNHVPWKPAYHGLVRAVVRVSLNAAGEDADRALAAFVNPDAGLGQSSAILSGPASNAPTLLTISASAPGLPTASINIALSVNAADSVLAVAASSVASAYVGN